MTLTGFVGPGINNRYHAIPEGIRISVPAVTFRGAIGYGLPGLAGRQPGGALLADHTISVCMSICSFISFRQRLQ